MSDVAVTEEIAGAVTLFGTDNPTEVIERAAKVAGELAALVRQQSLVVRIGQSDHVRVEGWTLLGSMLGVFPVVEWTRPVMRGDTQIGWEARVEARTRRGEVVGAGEAECLIEERTWKTRDDYARRAMAQTRATSRAMRGPLGFVMHLAGFNPTPAEEMPASGTPTHPEGVVVDDGKFPPDIDMAPPAVITEAQRRRLRGIQKESNVTDDQLKAIVADVAGVDSSKLIPAVRYDAVCLAVVEAGASQFKIPEGVEGA